MSNLKRNLFVVFGLAAILFASFYGAHYVQFISSPHPMTASSSSAPHPMTASSSSAPHPMTASSPSGALAVGNTTSNGPIGGLTAAQSVDNWSSFVITQTTLGIIATLPNPTNPTPGRSATVSNGTASAQPIQMYGAYLTPGTSGFFQWDGASWSAVPLVRYSQVAATTDALAVIAGSLGWWDAGNASATSSSWPDQSGNGNNWTSISHDPTLNTGGQGGRSYYHFSGAQGLTVSGLSIATNTWTVWAVGRTSSAGGNQFAVVVSGSAGVNLGFSGAGGSTDDVGTYGGGWSDSGFTATSVKTIASVGSRSPADVTFRVNGSSALSVALAGTYPGGANAYLGASDSVPQNPLTGDIYELAIWTSTLTTAQLAALDAYATAKYQIVPTTNLLVCDGNSFFAGNGASGSSYYLGQQILGLLGTGFGSTYINNGVGAESTPNMLIYAEAHSFPLYSSGIVPRMVDAACEGTNDIYFGATAAQAYANMTAYCQASRAAGFKVVTSTILSRSNIGTPPSFNMTRAAYNTLIRAGWPQFADGMADIASDSRIGGNGAETNTTYFSGDDVHPNNVGYAIIAGYYASAIQAIPQNTIAAHVNVGEWPFSVVAICTAVWNARRRRKFFKNLLHRRHR